MDDLHLAIAEAIRRARKQVAWKPNKDLVHLRKRQSLGHLPAHASVADYNKLIQAIVGSPGASVYAYRAQGSIYVAVHANLDRPWLAIFSLTGLMETAFPPDDIQGYLAQPGFTALGTVEELLT